MVVLVNLSADKQGLPRFRPPKVKALRPACLVLIDVLQGSYNGEIVDSISLGFLVICLSVSLAGGPPSPLSSRAGSQKSLSARVTIALYRHRL